MALSDIINVSIVSGSTQIERAGYGVPLLLAADCPAGFTERVRYYTTLTAVGVDFATTTATYLMAAALFSQNPKLPRIAVGRLANKPTQRWALTPTAVNTFVYQIKVNGTLLSYTSDGSATVSEINVGLKAAIDALSLGLTVSDQTTFMRAVANTAGVFFSFEVISANLKIAQDHADPGYAADLLAIRTETGAWYCVLNAFNSSAAVQAIAGDVEANQKLFIAQTQDSDVVDLSNGADTGGSQTVAGALHASARFRTALIYHPRTSAFADAAWAGATLSFDPGSETWAYKTLSGVPVTNLTGTQRTNALAKFVNVYELNAGVNYTFPGTVSGNEYIDVIRFRDWLTSTMQEEVFSALTKNKKIPYTDAGIALIQGIIKARLKAGIDVGGLAENPAPKVVVPKASAVSSGDKAARVLNGVSFDAVLAGAIQATTISGYVSV